MGIKGTEVVALFLTCKNLLPEVGEDLEIDDGSDDSLEGTELRVDAEGEEHEEEEHGPEGRPWELVDGLREHDESQTRPRGRLEEEWVERWC